MFTNVPLDENIGIYADYLYRGPLKLPSFPENVFVELMEMASESVPFSFNNVIYRQVDGVRMCPLMANIFVGFQHKQMFYKVSKPCSYVRHVDGTFASFTTHIEANRFFSTFEQSPPLLKTYDGGRK